jgi:hypothetical protein
VQGGHFRAAAAQLPALAARTTEGTGSRCSRRGTPRRMAVRSAPDNTEEAKQGLFKANARCARTTLLRDHARRRQKAAVRFLGGHDHERTLHVLGRLAVQRLGLSSERGGR